MALKLSTVKITLCLLLASGAILAFSSCGGNESKYSEGNILSILCVENSGITMDADIQYDSWEFQNQQYEKHYRNLYMNGSFLGNVTYSSNDSSATIISLICVKDATFRLEIDGCAVDKIISATAETLIGSGFVPIDINIDDYISFRHGKVLFTYVEPEYTLGQTIYLTVASTANRKTASFQIVFPGG